VAFVEEIDKGPARALAALADDPAVLDRAVEQLVVVLGPARPVLQPLMTGREKIAVHARGVVTLLDQLELHVTGIGQCDRQMDIVIAPVFVPEPVERQFLGDIPRADPADLYPVAHCLVDVAHHNAHLPQRAKKAAHALPLVSMASDRVSVALCRLPVLESLVRL
jgi:hypothetical protein